MTSIRDLGLNSSYVGRGEAILNEFLIPALGVATSYDRVTSFFTVDSLLAISRGVQGLFEHGGRMRLVIGIHSVPQELMDASLRRDRLTAQIDEIRHELRVSIASLTDLLDKKRLATLAWMIEDELLEVRVVEAEGQGIFHSKVIILGDSGGNKIVAVGSPNETRSGLGGNFESIIALKSWDDPCGVKTQEQFFASLWDGKVDGLITREITEELAETIKEALGSTCNRPLDLEKGVQRSDNVIEVASQMPAYFFVSGLIPALYQHQERAVIEALSRWPVRVLFCDEVGLGKTFEAAATMAFLLRFCGVRKVVILTPKAVLKQWQDELNVHFGIDAWVYDSAKQCYVSHGGVIRPAGKTSLMGAESPNIILISSQFARGRSGRKSIFEQPGAVLPDLLIVDEAHSARVSKDLSGNQKTTQMYQMLEKIVGKIPHVILATATPMQKDAGEYHALLKLLGLPKRWQSARRYKTSLDLIARTSCPDVSDATVAGRLVQSTINALEPDLLLLSDEERSAVESVLDFEYGGDSFEMANYIQENWDCFRTAFIKLHPAHLLTVRNTRRALTEIGYSFPCRHLHEVALDDLKAVRDFYSSVNEYISDVYCSVEEELYPARRNSIGFVKNGYQQRVASSLWSCRQSLRKRLDKLLTLKNQIDDAYMTDDSLLLKLGLIGEFDSAYEDMAGDDIDAVDEEDSAAGVANLSGLKSAVNLECAYIQPLIDEADALINSSGDMKVIKSIELALKALSRGDKVLLFSRYTDTIDALEMEFANQGGRDSFVYGVYVGGRSAIIRQGIEEKCDRALIKCELATGDLRLMICSDAASEGLNLQAARVLINVDVPWTPSRLEQRIGRIARLGQTAPEVDIYNVWYPNSIEARMYHRIQERLEGSNLAIGEYPEVVAEGILRSILDGEDEQGLGMRELQDIRNSQQTKALNRLWSSYDGSSTASGAIRRQLMELCKKHFEVVSSVKPLNLITFRMQDGSEVALSSREGLDESISLRSRPWVDMDVRLGDNGYVRDVSGRPAAFIKGDDVSAWLDHEVAVELLCGKPFDNASISKKYPKTLPNPKALSLGYAVDGWTVQAPSFWPPVCREEIR